jgi:hypothetical protein
MDVDDGRFDRPHAELGLIGGIAHFGIGEDRQIVELDAVVLAVVHQPHDAIDPTVERLAGQSQDQIRIGLYAVALEVALQFLVGVECDVLPLDRLERARIKRLHR